MTDNILIVGGAGFIGTNVAAHHLAQGRRVTLFDNFSRAGTEGNAEWLSREFGSRVEVIRGDVRDGGDVLARAVEQAQVVFHFAAQVAVTFSVTDPRHDFEVNALGTFNVLEAVRQSTSRPIVIYSSTNKVYGKMDDVATVQRGNRYEYRDLTQGIPADRPLDFYSPYGCSKGTGDQYVLDYSRIYGLRTFVFRQSCIYGPHQFGMEDQGWVAWFGIRALQDMPVTIYGDGMQVRDVLFIDDLNEAYDAAIQHIDRTNGRAYNIGGGPGYTLSLLELIDMLETSRGTRLRYSFDNWRPGDQLVYVSDISRAAADFGWAPRVPVREGLDRMLAWQQANSNLFTSVINAGDPDQNRPALAPALA